MNCLIKVTALWDVRLYSLVIPISNCWQWHINNWICVVLMVVVKLTLNLLMTTIVAPPSNASKRQMGFNSAFKGLIIG